MRAVKLPLHTLGSERRNAFLEAFTVGTLHGSSVSVDEGLFRWAFPLPRTHTGILQGNGLLGAMIWGEGQTLRLTLNRADLWDHRGGLAWTEKVNYAALRASLEASDEADLRERFEGEKPPPGEPRRPSRLPLGRLEFDLGPMTQLTSGTLNPSTGEVVIEIHHETAGREHIQVQMPMQGAGVIIRFPDRRVTEPMVVRAVTSWDLIGEQFGEIGFEPPVHFETGRMTGWVQPMPADPPVAVGWARQGQEFAVVVAKGGTVEDAKESAGRDVADLLDNGYERIRASASAWWDAYWADVPTINIPNPTLMFLYRYGMYKFAGLTHPEGVPGTLQGPWVEEHRFPPWSSDYHFNINVQECYWPAYRGNRLRHLLPLFDMIHSWTESLQENARLFLGIEDGLMLPHSVDDRCTCMGGFWSGAVDHGCTAWVAHMMYQYYTYSGNLEFLREKAYPFMVGAMRVHEEMLERESADGEGQLGLPVSVSPEYRGSRLDAWGKNASFQLACIHALAESLLEASVALNEVPRPIWREILRDLPKACVVGDPGEIYLWEGTPLEESHRHHSHLAGIYPFDVIDIDDPEWEPVVRRSIDRWIKQGMGMWSGWCMPWASILHTMVGHAETAELLLELWQRVFTNEGQGTLHDANFPGITLIGSRPMTHPDRADEKMQMDAGMGAVGAILEMLLHSRRGVHYVFAGAPAHWRDVSFEGIRAAGAFLVDAARSAGEVAFVRVYSEVGGLFRLADPWADGVIEIRLSPGGTRTLARS